MYATKEQFDAVLEKARQLESAVFDSEIDWEGVSKRRRLDIQCSPRYLFLYLAGQPGPKYQEALHELNWLKMKLTLDTYEKYAEIVRQLNTMLEDIISAEESGA